MVRAFLFVLMLPATCGAGVWYGGAGNYENPGYDQKSYMVAYPNPDLTPGSVVNGIDEVDVCKSGYSKKMRKELSKADKAGIYKQYGLPYDSKHYQIDHFIPLSIGGSNAPDNLWPQPINNNIGYLAKQQAANYLHNQVCAEKITIRDAQGMMRRDWHAVYLSIKKGGQGK